MTTQAGINPLQVTVLSETKYKTEKYEILTGFVKDGEMPQYIIRNRETGVVEFNHEVLAFAREWVAHFTERLIQLDNGKVISEDMPPLAASNFN